MEEDFCAADQRESFLLLLRGRRDSLSHRASADQNGQDIDPRCEQRILHKPAVRNSAELVCDLQRKRAHNARRAAKDTRQHRNLITIMGIERQRGDHCPVANVNHRIGHIPQDKANRRIHIQADASKAGVGEKQNRHRRIGHGSNHHPRAEFSPFCTRAIDNRAHEQVVNAIPKARDKKHDAQKCRR